MAQKPEQSSKLDARPEEPQWRKDLRTYIRGELTDNVMKQIVEQAEKTMPKEAKSFADRHAHVFKVLEYGKFLLRTNFSFGYIRPKRIE